MKPSNIPGYDQLTTDQQKSFTGIFEKYMAAKGTDARNDIKIKHVDVWFQGRFSVKTVQWGLEGYAILDPISNTWY